MVVNGIEIYEKIHDQRKYWTGNKTKRYNLCYCARSKYMYLAVGSVDHDAGVDETTVTNIKGNH